MTRGLPWRLALLTTTRRVFTASPSLAHKPHERRGKPPRSWSSWRTLSWGTLLRRQLDSWVYDEVSSAYARSVGQVPHNGVPRGIFSKYIPLDPLQHLGMTIRLEGVVAA